MRWFLFALRTPSRASVLALAAVSFVAAGVVGEGEASTAEGPLEVLMIAGGAAMLVVLVGWRWFWMGPAVFLRRMRRDPAFRWNVEQHHSALRSESARGVGEAALLLRPAWPSDAPAPQGRRQGVTATSSSAASRR